MRVFKDFLGKPSYGNPKNINRLEQRYRHIVEPFTDDIVGKRVLDLACHDGRWSYAFAFAGARSVVGVEGRPDVLARFENYPKSEITDRIELRCNDIFAELEAEIAAAQTYDVVAIFGVFYHIVDHFRLLALVRSLNPKLVIVDSEFVERARPIIFLNREDTKHDLNAIPGKNAETSAAVGTPSYSAMEMMANSTGYSIDWVDWSALPPDQRTGLKDYFEPVNRQKSRKTPLLIKRATCAMRPKSIS